MEIMSTNCTSCHGSNPINAAIISLETYDKVKSRTQSNLIDRISRSQGSSGMMPQGGTRLSQSTIDKVISWSNCGYVE
jgi:mono/diheme cytochrome c family protein